MEEENITNEEEEEVTEEEHEEAEEEEEEEEEEEAEEAEEEWEAAEEARDAQRIGRCMRLIPADGVRILPVGHLPIRIGEHGVGRGNCQLCGVRSSFLCTTCSRPLCIGRGQETCYILWHTLPQAELAEKMASLRR